MFHQASIKLAGLYLAIIMIISLFFSVNLYHISISELDKGFGHQQTFFDDHSAGNAGFIDVRDQFLSQRQHDFEDAKSKVISSLILTNIIILVGGGLLSYVLAKRTLSPIEQAHEAQGRFTADASHELRTPISAMRAEIEVSLMNKELSIAQARKLLESNLEELAKLTALSEGLLSLAQLDNRTNEKQKISAAEIIDLAVAKIAPLALQKKITIKLKDIEKAVLVSVDQESVVDALITIIDNAIKYSPENSKITVSAKSQQKKMLISVKDQGIGIKQTEQEHIFDRFYRADTARSKNTANGYGLGLAIAKAIIEQNDGTIDVVSSPAKGSVFTVILPTVKSEIK